MRPPMHGRGLRIGLDGDALRPPLSGVGQYVWQLCRALDTLLPDARFLVYTRLGDTSLPAWPSARWTVRREPVPALRRLPSFVWLRTAGRRLMREDALDVFWSGRTIGPDLGPGVRSVCTVHDLNHRLVPETMERPTRWSCALWFDREVRRHDVVLANSAGTAARLLAMCGRAADGIVSPGVDAVHRPPDALTRAAGARALAERFGIRPPYLLSVGTLEPRKNVARLLRGFVGMRRDGLLPDHQLVLAGARGWQDPAVGAEIEAARPLGVVMPGFVPDELMPALYACADLLVCPSLYEGFGMPVLEARACGTRTVVADVPELRESGGPHATVIAGDGDAPLRTALLQALARPAVPEPSLGDDCSWLRRGEAFVARALPSPSS